MSNFEQRLLLGPSGEPIDRVHGVETEYAFMIDKGQFSTVNEQQSDIDPEGYYDHEGLGRDTQAYRLFDYAEGRMNLFDGDGARRYVDVGGHPEYATPEDTDYLTTAHRVLYGHARMAKVAREAGKRVAELDGVDPGLVLIANNCDSSKHSWATHHNMLGMRAVDMMTEYVPVLALLNSSMIIWSGAGAVREGGTTEFGGETYDFSYHLSERAEHIFELANSATTHGRPLVNTRDEPHADDKLYRRLHGITNDSVLVPEVMALVLGSTSLGLRSAELKVPVNDLVPASPVRAMRIISKDPTLQAKVMLQSGKEYTGIELQLAFAERALQAAIAAEYITEQDRNWGEHWIELLDGMKSNKPESGFYARHLNWAIKLGSIVKEIEAKHNRESLARRDGNEAREVASDYAAAFEKSAYFHQLLPKEGLGMRLVRKGFFPNSPSGQVLEDGPPPPETRARLRGRVIRALMDRNISYAADWTGVLPRAVQYSGERRGTFRLKDPYRYETDEDIEAIVSGLTPIDSRGASSSSSGVF